MYEDNYSARPYETEIKEVKITGHVQPLHAGSEDYLVTAKMGDVEYKFVMIALFAKPMFSTGRCWMTDKYAEIPVSVSTGCSKPAAEAFEWGLTQCVEHFLAVGKEGSK